MRSILKSYMAIPTPILLVVGAELLLFLVTSSFILILNIHLKKLGYADTEIAGFTAYRFVGVLLFAFPMGLFIKGKRLKPFFYAAALIIPAASFLILEAARVGQGLWINVGSFGWGLGLMLLQVCMLPFIMRTAPEDVLSESISLSFSVWSLGMLISGATISLLSLWGQFHLGGISFPWDEYHIFRLIIVLSLTASGLLLLVKEPAPVEKSGPNSTSLLSFRDYDWSLILPAIAPHLIFAIGAGLTIPFMNLFFYTIFHVDSQRYSTMGTATAALVFLGAILMPALKRKFGFRQAILTPQIIATGLLILLALTELAAQIPGMLIFAAVCFILRQPLMQMAGPITSEMTVKYVGPKNRELISALNSSIWSGAWFISAKIFQHLRGANLPYYQIFAITVGLYGFGMLGTHLLLNDYERRIQNSESESVLPPDFEHNPPQRSTSLCASDPADRQTIAQREVELKVDA